MTKPEQRMWRLIRRACMSHWHAQRHEDRHSPDIADVSFTIPAFHIHGWLELKVFAMPKRESTLVRVGHFTPGQQRWLRERDLGAGYTFLLMYEPDMDIWLLVRGQDANAVGSLTYSELGELAVRVWEGAGMPGLALLRAIRNFGPQESLTTGTFPTFSMY